EKLSAREQQAVRDAMRQVQGANQNKPVVHDPRSKAGAIGFGVTLLLSGVMAFLWPFYLRELGESVKDEAVTEMSKKVVTYIGPGFFLWVIGTTIYQFAVGVGASPYVYQPPGKTLTVVGLITVQSFLIWIYIYLRRSLRSKARVKKPKMRPGGKPQ